jgi:hypothetical protein
VVQVLEGVAARLAGVAIPAIVAKVMARTGRAGAGLGDVLMAYGAAAAPSPALAGLVARVFGFSAAFIALGGIAALGLALRIFGLRAWLGDRYVEPGESCSSPRAG